MEVGAVIVTFGDSAKAVEIQLSLKASQLRVWNVGLIETVSMQLLHADHTMPESMLSLRLKYFGITSSENLSESTTLNARP